MLKIQFDLLKRLNQYLKYYFLKCFFISEKKDKNINFEKFNLIY